MVVESDATLREILDDVLRSDGWAVQVLAHGGLAAISAMVDERPDVVLLHVPLPVMEDFRAEQRRRPALASVPVVGILPTTTPLSMSRPLGLSGQLRLPLDLPRLLEILREAATSPAVRQGAAPTAVSDGMGRLAGSLAQLGERLPKLAQMVRRQALGNAALSAVVDEALAPSERGADKVLSFSRYLRGLAASDQDVETEVDVAHTVNLAVQIALGQIAERAVLRKELLPTPRVLSSPRQLTRVFVDLLVNAALAIPHGNPDESFIEVGTNTDSDGCAVVRIADNGQGIDPDLLPRIFDPLVSSRRGMGLGLAICRDVISAMHGEISVESELGRGTVVRVVLPPGRQSRRS